MISDNEPTVLQIDYISNVNQGNCRISVDSAQELLYFNAEVVLRIQLRLLQKQID